MIQEKTDKKITIYLTDRELKLLKRYSKGLEQTVQETAAQIVADVCEEELNGEK